MPEAGIPAAPDGEREKAAEGDDQYQKRYFMLSWP